MCTLVQIFDACNQEWFDVDSVLESVASEIVNMELGVKELFLRSDNAGCYHKAALLSSAAAKQWQGCVRPKDCTTQGAR